MNRTAGRRIRIALRDRARRGIAAVEFALTLPIWIAMLLGIADGSYFLLANEKIDRIAYTVTDVVTQYEVITKADLADIMLAAEQLMKPLRFNPENLGQETGTSGEYVEGTGYIIVTSVFQPQTGNPVVTWQYSYPPAGNGVSLPASVVGSSASGSPATLPNGLTLNAQDNVIITEVSYSFKPMFLDAFLAKVINRIAVYKPRLSPLTTPPI